MYRTLKIQVKQNHPMYPYFEKAAHLVNNLYNAGLFRCRQLMSASKKDVACLTANEKEVLAEVSSVFPKGRRSLGYAALNKLLATTRNPDYYAEGLARQAAQQTIKAVARDIDNFFSAIRAYSHNPSTFTGKPNLPGYHKKGGMTTVVYTNQDCVIYSKDGRSELKFPNTKDRLSLGNAPIWGRLMEVKIKPFHDIFYVLLTLDDGEALPEPKESPERVCAIDFGVNNFAAITNNAGLPFLLFKGGVMKSQNQWYNKLMAKIKSEQTKGDTKAFVPTGMSNAACLKRENRVMDSARKFCKYVVCWCIENEIDTIVVGKNNGWKQESPLGKKENQEFVQMPFDRIIGMLKLKAMQTGIRFIEQEESYTSKASFLDSDAIPVYGETGTDTIVFSGKRRPKQYKGNFKKDGFRGLYTTGSGDIVNSDLNGSANIGRKAMGDLFCNIDLCSYKNYKIIPYPDYETMQNNRKEQMTETHQTSKSKMRRLRKKQPANQM